MDSPPDEERPTTIRPSSVKLPPRLDPPPQMLSSQMVAARPPERETFSSPWLVKNPSHSPSGEKNGLEGESVSRIGTTSS